MLKTYAAREIVPATSVVAALRLLSKQAAESRRGEPAAALRDSLKTSDKSSPSVPAAAAGAVSTGWLEAPQQMGFVAMEPADSDIAPRRGGRGVAGSE